jgi:hypothetical protein
METPQDTSFPLGAVQNPTGSSSTGNRHVTLVSKAANEVDGKEQDSVGGAENFTVTTTQDIKNVVNARANDRNGDAALVLVDPPSVLIQGFVAASRSTRRMLSIEHPSSIPSDMPSDSPSEQPSDSPSDQPSDSPSLQPSQVPGSSSLPSDEPSDSPSSTPSVLPTSSAFIEPIDVSGMQPSQSPSGSPNTQPSILPTSEPIFLLSVETSDSPSSVPTIEPSLLPSSSPSDEAWGARTRLRNIFGPRPSDDNSKKSNSANLRG